MADTLRSPVERCPPLRQVRGTVLNTIMEDSRESQFAEKGGSSSKPLISPKLTLKTSGFSLPKTRLARLMSPLSACTTSSCSDTEWQQQIQRLDDFYDATDEEDLDESETDIDSTCFSLPGTQRSSLITPITRNSVTSTGSRKSHLTLKIPSPTVYTGTHKNSPVPPTPPPKIPVSPMALMMLGRSVPASHAPPSLDGSISSDQESNLSALATPDSHSLPDTDWDAHDFHLRPDLDGNESADLENHESQHSQAVPITIESPQDDWRQVLQRFPQIPSSLQGHSLTAGHEISRETTPSDQGVFLPDGALAMLQHIRLDGTPESWSETSEGNDEMWQLQAPPSRPRSADGVTPASAMSGYSFSELSIPSPGGFFASLGPRARHTWSLPNTNYPPTSAVAEGFYGLPWRCDEGDVVEQVIEWPDRSQDDNPVTAVRDEEGPPTAIRIPCEMPTQPVAKQDSPINVSFEAIQEITRASNVYEYDDCYDQEMQERANASLDRTNVWLSAQATYLAALSETNPVNNVETVHSISCMDGANDERPSSEEQDGSPEKAVRFEGTVAVISSRPPMLASPDSLYWRGFQYVLEESEKSDGFLHRSMRYDAVQSFRLGHLDTHINCLMGKYELVRPERPAYKGPFSKAPRSSTVTSELADRALFSYLEKEQLVLTQLCQPMWAMDAFRSLNGGKLLNCPLNERLVRTRNLPGPQDIRRQRVIRVLDLGGHATCEWAWHAAYEYPNVKFYSAIIKDQAANSGIKGPINHRVVSVPELWKLPFGDNKFDVITTRSLHALLKTRCPAGLDSDEYDLVLKECLRCLRPGGFLEFMVLDAEISQAGPFSKASSLEFALDLRTQGYDPAASKSFLSRLRKGGFIDIKRAWMFLPMGMEPTKPEPLRETPAPRVPSQIEEYEAVQGPIGSTEDVASVTGLLGGWMWEQWLVKFRMEMGLDQSKWLEGVGAMFDEGRKNGAGWTCLSGWAMKPRQTKQAQKQKNQMTQTITRTNRLF
ncbi:hypothetical protein N7495_004858 [Penicillium taxi]|uniref:uncharacterized protein n=1 Tax=Penicillium taxi TaxID=168475 RepID=UPI002544D36C|nr:uncharacterized protein N7495_004858 [Penicillium taxi]KAJ5900114.1 hypothetical protein N7495_004858 [Penicillium taxi]